MPTRLGAAKGGGDIGVGCYCGTGDLSGSDMSNGEPEPGSFPELPRLQGLEGLVSGEIQMCWCFDLSHVRMKRH